MYLREFFLCINKGQITIIQDTLDELGANRAFMKSIWEIYRLDEVCTTPAALLGAYVDAFTARYAAVPAPKRHAAIVRDIAAEMIALQGHPDIMAEYRRFVVIKASTEKDIPRWQDGVSRADSSGFCASAVC